MTDRTEEILGLFEQINSVPRKSGNRRPIKDWLTKWAHDSGFRTSVDDESNTVIYVPGSPEYKNAPPIILQAHTDMGCEKEPESNHDFAIDPILHIRNGDWLMAEGTSLGADNGIGLAMALEAAIDSECVHPPLEILATSDEEIGLLGAKGLDTSMLSGRILINLDSEDLGHFVLGCAGAQFSTLILPVEKESITEYSVALRLELNGFIGGHSAADINKGRGNAIAEMIRGLLRLHRIVPFHLAGIDGGSACNAIPRNAEAIIALPAEDVPEAKEIWDGFLVDIRNEYKHTDPRSGGGYSVADPPVTAMTADSGLNVLRALSAIPTGILSYDPVQKDTPETSLNIGSIRINESNVEVVTLHRSSMQSKKLAVTDRLRSLMELVGGELQTEDEMKPWEADWDSQVLTKALEVWKNLNKGEAVTEVTHGGLECGVIAAKIPGMETISFGPDIENPHSPRERLRISSVSVAYDFLRDLLGSYCN